jgi:hypothetical protein
VLRTGSAIPAAGFTMILTRMVPASFGHRR